MQSSLFRMSLTIRSIFRTACKNILMFRIFLTKSLIFRINLQSVRNLECNVEFDIFNVFKNQLDISNVINNLTPVC